MYSQLWSVWWLLLLLALSSTAVLIGLVGWWRLLIHSFTVDDCMLADTARAAVCVMQPPVADLDTPRTLHDRELVSPMIITGCVCMLACLQGKAANFIR